MKIKKAKLLNNKNLNEVVGYKDVEVYKNLVDFEWVNTNKKMQYEIFGLKKQVKENDYIYLDLAVLKDKHKYIYGRVVKVLKSKIVIDYVYVNPYDLI